MRERFHTTIDSELKREIKLIAIKQCRDTNDILEDLIKEYIDKINRGDNSEHTSRS